jgi:hypothetical protein
MESTSSLEYKMSSTPEFRKEFVARLNQACDQSSIVPPPFQGRQQMISNRLSVAPEAVSKWFKAISMPRPAKMQELADLLEVDVAWLSMGVKVELDRAERKVHAGESSGAVLLVRALITLAGGHCGDAQPADPRAAYVDFYATLRGQVWPMHISLGREVNAGRYEVAVIKEFKDVRNIAVVALPGEKYQFLDLPVEMIETHKHRKTGEYIVTIDRADAKYTTDGESWPRIRAFGEIV